MLIKFFAEAVYLFFSHSSEDDILINRSQRPIRCLGNRHSRLLGLIKLEKCRPDLHDVLLDFLGVLVDSGSGSVDHGLFAAGDAGEPGVERVQFGEGRARASGKGPGQTEPDLHAVAHVSLRTDTLVHMVKQLLESSDCVLIDDGAVLEA